MGARRVDEAFIYLPQAAQMLGTTTETAKRKLANAGVGFQTLRVKGREKRVYLREAVRQIPEATHLTVADGQTLSDEWAGTSGAAEILGIKHPPNVGKTLDRYGVEAQTLTIGLREMKIYPRTEVERVAKQIETRRSG